MYVATSSSGVIIHMNPPLEMKSAETRPSIHIYQLQGIKTKYVLLNWGITCKLVILIDVFDLLTPTEGKSDHGASTEDWVAKHSLENSCEPRETAETTAWSHSFHALLQQSHLCSAAASHSQLSVPSIKSSYESLVHY